MRPIFLTAAILAGAISSRGAYPGPPESLSLVPGQRQLFLDDFVVGHLYRVDRLIHQPRKYEGNPVIRPDLPTDGVEIQTRDAPSWDEKEKIWKTWYWIGDGSPGDTTGFARSPDGIHWEKPNLGLVEKNGNRNNNLVTVKDEPDAFIQHVFLDPTASRERRYKGMIGPYGRRPCISADGYVFTALSVPPIPSQDESDLNWDSLSKQYIMTVKHVGPFGRSVYLTVSRDFEKWTDPKLIYHADSLDQALGARQIREVEANPRMWHPTINHPSEYRTEIYFMPIFAYEGLYIGMPNYFEASGLIPLPVGNQDGTNSVKLACSRDLCCWTAVGDRRHFLPISEMGRGGWDTGQVLATSHPIRRGNELWIYYSGLDVRYRPSTARARGGIGLARLRLDGFVSLHAGAEEGIVETRPIRFEGERLYVNADASKGRIRAEITDFSERMVLKGRSRDRSLLLSADSLRSELRWQGSDGMKDLRGQVVRIRFYLENADLYSFWLEEGN